MHWIRKYLGSRYVDHGRILPELDCWGLVRAVLRERGVGLFPAFGAVHPDDKSGMTEAMTGLISTFATTPPTPDAIACLFRGEVLLHVGVVLAVDGVLVVLHTGRRTGPRLQPVESFLREYGASNVRFYKYVYPAFGSGPCISQQTV